MVFIFQEKTSVGALAITFKQLTEEDKPYKLLHYDYEIYNKSKVTVNKEIEQDNLRVKLVLIEYSV